MEEKRFSLSGPNTKCNITVGYISSERGFVDGLGVYEANHIAKLNPGTQFIFRNRDFVKYLNINEVNALTPNMMLPEKRSGAKSCSGIVGLNLEGDTSKSIDVTLDADRAYTGGSTKDSKAVPEKDKTAVNFYGGGGVGVQAAPIIGNDGSILAVQVIHGGYGYKYAPIVDITDDTGKGGGVVARSIIKTRTSDEGVLIEEFDAEDDYEEYVLDKCVPEMENIGYGQRWSPDGKNLGKWDPSVYFNKSIDPIAYEIQRYQKYLLNLGDGASIEGNKIKGWWTTRQKAPLRVISADKVTREKFDVQHPAWGGLVSKSSNNNSNKTSSTFGVGTSLIESSFLVYTSGGQRRDLKFIFKSTSGNHSFEIRADDYKNNASAEEIKIKVKRNTKYNVTTTSRKGIRDKGLLKNGVFGTGGDIAQRTGTSNAIFSDIGKTAPDDDDLQVQCKQGTFFINKGNITYELKDSTAFNAEKNSKYSKGIKDNKNKNTAIQDSFMNQYAISPVAPSNVAGSDKAGINYTFEWEEEFPYEGEYVFNIQADNESHLYIDNDSVGDKILLGSGGAAGHILSPPTKIKKFVSAGMRKIRLDLLNHQIMEMKKIQKDVVATSDEVTFTVTTASLYANGFEIPDLGINIGKEYGNGKDIRETITKKVEYGRVYPVKFKSSNQRVVEGGNGDGTVIRYEDLNPSNKTIRVAKNNTCIELKDGRGNDANVKFTITSGDAKFSDDGRRIIGKGKVGLNLWYDDNPRYSGEAVRSIAIGKTKWVKERKHKGGESKTITLDGGNTTAGGNNTSNIRLRNKGEQVIEVEDIPGTFAGGGGVGVYWDDIIISVNNGRLYGINGSSCNFTLDAPVDNKGGSTLKGERAHIFNTVDWIKKANRKLWKMNSGAGKDSNFISRFGVLPFDPTEVVKIEKKVPVVPPSVKFEVGDDGKTYLKVIGKGRVKVGFEMDVDDEVGNRFGAAVREVKIFSDEGQIILKRTGTRFEKLNGTGMFTSGKKYLIKSLGGSQTSGSKIGVDKTVLQFDDAVKYGFDGRGYANVKVKSITPIDTPELKNIIKFNEQNWDFEEGVGQLGSSGYETVISTDDYAGFHEIIWNNITFPESGNYSVAVMVDDNVELKFTRPNKKDIVITKEGFSFGNNPTTYSNFGSAIQAVNKGRFSPTGKSVFIKYFESGTYTLNAVLEQIPGGTIAEGNVMGLAVDIKAAFVSDEIEVISSKSWNENPMGVALSIDAPFAPIPKEPPQQQEGRCPNNPIWTTRSTNAVNEIWYPVNVNSWGKFMNRYSISPLPPLGLKGTDGAGAVYRNSWKVELPYRGFYGVKGTVDNFGKLFIDGVEVLGPNVDSKFDTSQTQAPKTKKILLEKKTVDITVEVENEKQFIWNTIDQKVFSTADWASKQNNTSTTIEGAKNIDVDFKVSIASLYGNGIKLFDAGTNDVLFDSYKPYKEYHVPETHTKNIEVGKVYDVEFRSDNQRVIPGNISQNRKAVIIDGEGKNPGNRRVGAGGLTYDFDNAGFDWEMDASFRITSGNARFEETASGPTIVGTGRVTIELWWNQARGDDDEDGINLGNAIKTIKVGKMVWDARSTFSSNRVKLEDRTRTIDLGPSITTGDTVQSNNNNSAIALRNKGKNVIEMEDIPGNFFAGTGGTNDPNIFFKDLVCSATDGEFYNIQGRRCKYRIPSKDKTTIEYGKGLTSGSSKSGVIYSGPPLSTYISGTLGPFLTPTWNTDEEYIANFNGKTWTMTFSNVDFPEKGTYDIQAEADDKLTVKLDGVEIATSEVGNGITKTQFNAPKGKRTIELTLMNLDFNAPFSQNPAVAAVKITRKVQVAKVDPRSGTALGKPWTVNPLGVSAILIPPPCPKKIDGVGIVTAVIIDDPGNGFDPPEKPDDDGDPSGPSVIIEVDTIDPENPGINYGPDDKVCIVNTETGEEVCYIPPKGPFGEIFPFDPRITPPVPGGPPDPPDDRDPPGPPTPTVTITATPPVIPEGKCTELVYTSAGNTKLVIDNGVGEVPVTPRGTVKVCPPVTTTYKITGDGGDDGGGSNTATTTVTVVKDPDDPLLDAPPEDGKQKPPNGYREYPQIIVRGRGTGIGYKGIPRMKAVLDPIGVDPKRLIQVTDLPGLKQTGYYEGKPYYGAIFYENGVSYAGYYDTPGQKVQIYATLQESIDAQVTTPPSAIQRQGTDVNSNNSRLNIPGTPDNLT